MTVDFSKMTDQQLDEFIGDSEPKTKQTPLDQDFSKMTDQQLDEFISGQQDIVKPKKLLKGAKKGLETLESFASQVSFGAMDTLDQLGQLLGVEVAKTEEQLEDTGPKNALESAGRIVGEFGTPMGPQTKLLSGATNILKSPKAVANLTRIKTAFEPIARQAKKSTATVIETLSSVPAEFVKRALDNPKILEGKFNPKRFRELGKKAKNALKTISEREGKAVVDEQNALKGAKTRVSVIDHIDNLQAAKAQAEASERVGSALTDTDIKKIDEIVDKLTDIATTPKDDLATQFELHTIKRQIDNLVSFDDIKVSKPAASILKKERAVINEKLRDLNPKYKLANAEFERVADIRTNILPKLREANLGVNIKTIMRKPDDFLRNNLKELDSTLPMEDRFYNELADLTAREPFEALLPGQGGGSGGQQGVANLLRTLLAHATRGAVIPLTSPLTQKQLIKKGPKIAEKSKGLIKRVAPRALIRSAPTEQQTQEEN